MRNWATAFCTPSSHKQEYGPQPKFFFLFYFWIPLSIIMILFHSYFTYNSFWNPQTKRFLSAAFLCWVRESKKLVLASLRCQRIIEFTQVLWGNNSIASNLVRVTWWHESIGLTMPFLIPTMSAMWHQGHLKRKNVLMQSQGISKYFTANKCLFWNLILICNIRKHLVIIQMNSYMIMTK